jgi:hypothetical protein
LIKELGLPQCAHDLWFCADQGRKVAAPVEDFLTSVIAA